MKASRFYLMFTNPAILPAQLARARRKQYQAGTNLKRLRRGRAKSMRRYQKWKHEFFYWTKQIIEIRCLLFFYDTFKK